MQMTYSHSPEPGNPAGPVTVTSSENVGAKRQRRPSVRLGEIGGDQLYEKHQNHSRRVNNGKQWKNQQSFNFGGKKDVGIPQKASRTRALTNLNTCSNISGGCEFLENLGNGKDLNLDCVAIGSRKVRDCKKRGSNAAVKRVRSNWVSQVDNGVGGSDNNAVGDYKFISGELMDGSYRDFDRKNSESPVREHSSGHSIENSGDGIERSDKNVYFSERGVCGIENRNFNDGVEMSGPSDTEAREYMKDGGCGEDGVRNWLNSIGLGRYASVFEIHEVDGEILPLLTLEDLKDMGITAVGSRRKLFCAIQKLGKCFS